MAGGGEEGRASYTYLLRRVLGLPAAAYGTARAAGLANSIGNSINSPPAADGGRAGRKSRRVSCWRALLSSHRQLIPRAPVAETVRA